MPSDAGGRQRRLSAHAVDRAADQQHHCQMAQQRRCRGADRTRGGSREPSEHGRPASRLRPSHNLFGRTDVMRLDHIATRSEMLGILGAPECRSGGGICRSRRLALHRRTSRPTCRMIRVSLPAPIVNGSWMGQWYLLPSSSTTPSAISATTAWQTATGSVSSIVIAVIDYRRHRSRIRIWPPILQTPGYDFVSCDQGNFTAPTTGARRTADCSATRSAAQPTTSPMTATAGTADASDPGDWIDATDMPMTVVQECRLHDHQRRAPGTAPRSPA